MVDQTRLRNPASDFHLAKNFPQDKIKVEEDIENENLAKKKKKKNGSVTVATANSSKTETPIMPTDNTSKQVSDSKDLDKPEDDEYASKPLGRST